MTTDTSKPARPLHSIAPAPPPTIAVLIQARIDAKGWTLTRFARAAGMSTSGLRKIMRGQVPKVTGSTVRRLAKALAMGVGKKASTPTEKDLQSVRAACDAQAAVGVHEAAGATA